MDRERQQRLQQRNVPRRFARVILSDDIDEGTIAMQHVRRFESQSERCILLMCGNVGVGKSLAASAWLDSFDGGMFVTAQQLRRMSTFDEREYQRVSEPYRLVIDDLGTEYSDAKDFWVSTFDGFMNDRYLSEKPTIITCNGASSAILKRYGDRFTDRMREAGIVVEVAGESRRRK